MKVNFKIRKSKGKNQRKSEIENRKWKNSSFLVAHGTINK